MWSGGGAGWARTRPTRYAYLSGRQHNLNSVMWDFLATHWAEIALAVVGTMGTVTALTETSKDDSVVDILKRILNAVVMGKNKP